MFINQVTVLHPHHKLHYFKTAGWEDAWIQTAHDIVRDEFDRTYAFMDVATETESKDLKKVAVLLFS
jgi:cobalamin biosynthesis Co2+ chelatase CbiK